jgi:hypothetical protein
LAAYTARPLGGRASRAAATARGVSRIRAIHGTSFAFTYSTPCPRSTAAPPHSPPPSKPGSTTVPSRLGGAKGPPWRRVRKRARAAARAAGVRVVRLSAVTAWRANGAGSVGKGCVGHARSPRRSDGSTGRSSIGKSGAPLARSNRKTNPVFVICATASTGRPSRATVSRVGAAGRSRSSRSWWTVW